MTIREIMSDYFATNISGETANERLSKIGGAPRIATDGREIPSAQRFATSKNVAAGFLNGWCLMNTGSSFMEKIEIKDGRSEIQMLPGAEVFFGGEVFTVTADGYGLAEGVDSRG